MFDRRLLMALAANSMAGNFIDMNNGGGVGLINFLVFPANANITSEYPELYNQLLSFFTNFNNYKIAYPIAYTIESDYLLLIHTPNPSDGIEISNDDTATIFRFESVSNASSTSQDTITLYYDKTTQEIYSIKR